MSDYATPLVGVAAVAEDWESRPALLHRYERRQTPITLVDVWFADTGGIVLEEITDEPTAEQCGLCLKHRHDGVCGPVVWRKP